MDTQSALGFAHFVSQADAIGRSILVMLLAMSIATWYVIGTRTIRSVIQRVRTARFLKQFHGASSPKVLAEVLVHARDEEPFANVARHAIAAARHNDSSEFVMRSVRRALDDEAAHTQTGLAVLASVGSTAPFIGLLGTVWGVYQALVSIGMTGQGTIDKVAGPVGEALIMTGLGLAVAIPAVLAYNFAVRRNRAFLARLDSYAHDVFTLISTGSHIAALQRSTARLFTAREAA